MKSRTITWAILSIAISIIIHWTWFFNLAIVSHGDWQPHALESLRQDFSVPSLWNPNSLGGVDLSLSFYPFNLLSGILARLDISYGLIERFLFLWPLTIISAVSSYLFIRKISNSDIGGVIGSFVFCYNTYFLIGQTGHLTLMMSFALAPLIFYFFIKTIEQRSSYLAVVTGLICFIASYYEIRAFYITAWVLVLYFFSWSITANQTNWRSILKNSFLLLVPLIIVGLLNVYWLTALAKVGSLTENIIFSRGLFGNSYMNIKQALTLFHPWWTGVQPAVFYVQPMPTYFWLIPLLSGISLVLQFRNRQLLFWGGMALVGVLLTKQVDEPFTNLYLWLFNNFPGFHLYREGSKFYFLISIAYAVLIGSLVGFIWNKSEKHKWHIYGKYGLTIFIAALFLWNAKPLISREIGTLFVPRAIPNDYILYNNFILNQKEHFRTLWTPTDSRWGIDTLEYPRMSNVALTTGELKPFINFKDYEIPTKERIVDLLRQPFSDNFLDSAAVKYIIVPIEDIANDDNFYSDYGLSRQFYLKEVERLSYLKRVDIGTNELVIYENQNYKSYISTASSIYSINSLDFPNDKYKFITQELKSDINYIAQSNNDATGSAINLDDIFDKLNRTHLSGGSIKIPVPHTGRLTIYSDSVKRSADKEGTLQIHSKTDATAPFEDSFLAGSKNSANPPAYVKEQISLKKEDEFQFSDPRYTYSNLISNPSLEKGLWSDQVGDCNNHDHNGKLNIALTQTDKSDGQNALQLEATRHIACTSPDPVQIKENSNYLFSFDYQSSNATQASYFISFDDPNHTVISEKLPIKDQDWHPFDKIIQTPKGAGTYSLTVYSHSHDNVTNIITRYDNFGLIELPNILDRYYLLSQLNQELKTPANIAFTSSNPTRKLVHITGATTPFYLNMSEAYHPQWQLQMNNSKINSGVRIWGPWANPDKVSEENHYKLNGFLNSWYTDVNQLCKEQNLCQQNADGTYNMEMVIEFWPQRWLYVGSIISGGTLLGCIGYLLLPYLRRFKKKVKNKEPFHPSLEGIYHPVLSVEPKIQAYWHPSIVKLRLKMTWYSLVDWFYNLIHRRTNG